MPNIYLTNSNFKFYVANEVNHTPFTGYLGSDWAGRPTWDAADHNTLNDICWYYISNITILMRKIGVKMSVSSS